MKGETKMDAHEPHVRRRGFFLHSETGEPDAAEVENPEGFVVRVRVTRSVASAKGSPLSRTGSGSRFSSRGRSRTDIAFEPERLGIRSGSVTGSRQRAHLPR